MVKALGLLLFLSTLPLLHEKAKVMILLKDTGGRAVTNVRVVGAKNVTGDDGKFVLLLEGDFQPGRQIEITLESQSEWVFPTPRYFIRLPANPNEWVTVVLFRPGEIGDLHDPDVKRQIIDELAAQRSSLAELAENLDLKMEDLKRFLENSSPQTVETKIEPFDRKPGGYYILILPFSPDRTCRDSDVYVAKNVKKGLKKWSAQLDLGLEVRLVEGAGCPDTYEEGREIGKAHNADLVIWGNYADVCSSKIEACLEYALIETAPLGAQMQGQTTEKKVGLSDIRQGKLHKDIDFLVLWTLGLAAYEKDDYERAISFFEKSTHVKNKWRDFYLGYAHQEVGMAGNALKFYSNAINEGLNHPAVFSNRGSVYVTMGNLVKAESDFTLALAIREKLAEADPTNAGWQRDLSASQANVGDVLQAQGDGAGALASYRASLAIREKLAEADPTNAGWQRDLSVSFNKIGDVLQAQGDGAGALASYRASLAIAQKLAEADPTNAGWQRDLSVSLIKMALHYSGSEKSKAKEYISMCQMQIQVCKEKNVPVDPRIESFLNQFLENLE